jgi:hypothetical protein
MRSKGRRMSGESQTGQGCCHYWLVEPPNDQMSLGVCRRCGEVRQFENYLDATINWTRTPESRQTEEGSRLTAKRLPGKSNANKLLFPA